VDVETDQLHPRKRLRPFASGRLTYRSAAILMALAGLLAVAGSMLLPAEAQALLLLYGLTTFAYSLWLKRVLFLDVVPIIGTAKAKVGAVVDRSNTALHGLGIALIHAQVTFALGLRRSSWVCVNQ